MMSVVQVYHVYAGLLFLRFCFVHISSLRVPEWTHQYWVRHRIVQRIGIMAIPKDHNSKHIIRQKMFTNETQVYEL